VLGDDIVARGGAGGDDHGKFVGVLDLVHMRAILYPDGAASRGASTRLHRRRRIVDFRTDRRLFGK
jgi:hypothetical protein